MTSKTWRSVFSVIAIYAVLTSSACARGGGPESEPPPPPPMNPSLAAGLIAVCRDATLELKLPPVAAGTCVTDLQEASGGQWPGPKTSPVDGVSDAFRAASGVINTWIDRGWISRANGGSSIGVVMSNMKTQREILEPTPR